jgi:hypothetical protein
MIEFEITKLEQITESHYRIDGHITNFAVIVLLSVDSHVPIFSPPVSPTIFGNPIVLIFVLRDSSRQDSMINIAIIALVQHTLLVIEIVEVR